jgi:hypothetical protein
VEEGTVDLDQPADAGVTMRHLLATPGAGRRRSRSSQAASEGSGEGDLIFNQQDAHDSYLAEPALRRGFGTRLCLEMIEDVGGDNVQAPALTEGQGDAEEHSEAGGESGHAVIAASEAAEA